MSKRGSRGHTPNDMRSMAMNPYNRAFNAAQINRANQLNPLSPTYASSRGLPVAGSSAPQDPEPDDHAVEDFAGSDDD